ncbi:hypothetical protein [Actinoplanes sp. NPDC051859]|uniref:hypothetical protein n=1 Tax=Actinoplanes sp. NPDC051859 TaxID=3363909 RepID=UPI0037A61399
MAGDSGKRRIMLVGLAAVAVLAAAVACSAEQSKDGAAPQVATLTSGGASPAASGKPAERPRERLDTTEEEFEALMAPYRKCLKEQGGKDKKDWTYNGDTPLEADIRNYEKADKFCNPLFYPLPPWERDPKNPESKDFTRDVVKCLKGKGVRYVEAGENGLSFGGPQNDQDSISKGLEYADDCEREVAAKK